jgi:hypothetical protein
MDPWPASVEELLQARRRWRIESGQARRRTITSGRADVGGRAVSSASELRGRERLEGSPSPPNLACAADFNVLM